MDDEKNNETGLRVIDGGADRLDITGNMALCREINFMNEKWMEPVMLFQGFDSLRAITFSYQISFIENLIERFGFKDGEIILGAEFLVRKDNAIQDYYQDVMANAEEATQCLRSHKKLVELAKEGNFEFRVPEFIIDHRKQYYLRSDDGRCRYIGPSANLTSTFTDGGRLEGYVYADGEENYDRVIGDFDDAWERSVPITPEMLLKKDSDNIKDSNPILKKAEKAVERLQVFVPEESTETIRDIRYFMDHDKCMENYKAVCGKIEESQKGMLELTPKTVEKIAAGFRRMKAKEKIRIETVKETYPCLELDIENEEAKMNGEPLDLHPSDEAVKSDIREILDIFSNFDDFVDRLGTIKEMHYRAMAFVFASPFFSYIRCAYYAKTHNLLTNLPLYMIYTSPSSDSGKTFMVEVFLKLMTGKDDVKRILQSEINLKDPSTGKKLYDNYNEYFASMQSGRNGIPWFIDEIDSSFFTRTLTPLMKNSDFCEKGMAEGQPLLIFASNQMGNPSAIIRKRSVWFNFDAGLPSTTDRASYALKGGFIKQRLSNAFYHEYLRRMLDLVKADIDKIWDGDMADGWYPDIVNESSRVIMSIIKDFGYEVPDFMSELHWKKDFEDSRFASENIAETIENLYNENKKMFRFTNDRIVISLGNDSQNAAMVKDWKNVLPSEAEASYISKREGITFTLKREPFEKMLGHPLRKKWFLL